MTDDDARPGFDRRALIKRGLVAGGIAATVPVITTFNTAAFAASQPGCHRVRFDVTNATTTPVITLNPSATATGCEPDDAQCSVIQTTFITGPTQITAGVVGNIYTFQLQGSYSSCEFVAARANRTNAGGLCLAEGTGFSAMGGSTVTFDRGTAFPGSPAATAFTVILLVVC